MRGKNVLAKVVMGFGISASAMRIGIRRCVLKM